jgi:hypothetical protein
LFNSPELTIKGEIEMKNWKRRILFTILSGIVLMIVGISTSYAQGTPVDFGGTWNTVTGKGKKIVITLQSVRRISVTGTYARNGLTASIKVPDGSDTAFVKVAAISGEPALQSISTITGTVTDNVLRFKWLEDGGHGAGRFTMSSDGQSFEGTFSKTDNPDDTSGGTWNGTRRPSFGGAWQATFGGSTMILILQQGGDKVSGQLKVNSADFGFIREGEGIIDDRRLRFTIWRPGLFFTNGGHLPDQYVGIGELVMDAGGKSFKGTILGTATSGTRLGR